MNRRFTVIIATVFVVVVIAATAYVNVVNGRLRGVAFNPPQQAPEIVLTDQSKQTYRLGSDGGKVVLLFFGYTNCPDECPLTMAKLKQAMNMLNNRANDVQVLFVTTDPARDTPEVLGQFLNKFNPDFVGLSGTQDELQKVWDSYSVVVENGGETHTAFVYLIDQDGDLRAIYPLDAEAGDIAHDIKLLLRQG